MNNRMGRDRGEGVSERNKRAHSHVRKLLLSVQILSSAFLCHPNQSMILLYVSLYVYLSPLLSIYFLRQKLIPRFSTNEPVCSDYSLQIETKMNEFSS